MVRILKDNSYKRCVCYYCKSVLEYSSADVEKRKTHPNEYEEIIKCPACGNNTGIDSVPKEGDY